MKIFLDCLPCVLNQILLASRISTADLKLQKKIMGEATAILANFDRYSSSPDIVAELHHVVKKLTGVADPYREVKNKDIAAALQVYPYLKKHLGDQDNKMEQALKISVTGNIMDSAILKEVDLDSSLMEELEKPFSICDLAIFEEMLRSAETILFIGDNAGETVFDRVFTEYLARPGIYYAVRDVPIINDATMEDAIAAGIGNSVKLFSSGSDAPGAILNRCNEEFRDLFEHADLVISKGQGNFEALSDCGRDVFFLLKAKCPMIADRLAVDLNEYVFVRGGKAK